MLAGHGGNIYAVARRFGWRPSELIDMSSNINPLGPPSGLMDYLKDKLSALTVLPEADCEQTIAHFAAYSNIAPERILAGNGTTQLIYNLPRVLNSKNALILGPTYSDYADAFRMHRSACTLILTEESEDFLPDVDRLKNHLEGKDTVVICNPNNPTGRAVAFDDLQRLCRTHPQINFVIDESYLPFVPEAENRSMVNSEAENVIVLSSLSKIFKVPGLRIGFMITSPRMVEKFKAFLTPWSVNSLAQAAVYHLAMQKDQADVFIQDSRMFLETQRKEFYDRFRNTPQIKLYPSCTSFVLIKLPATITAEAVWTSLVKEKILIRNCSNFEGLTDRYIRISLKTPETNRMVTEKLIALMTINKPILEKKRVA